MKVDLEEYCDAVSKSALMTYNNESRKQKVIEGVRAAMSESGTACVEANAAKKLKELKNYPRNRIVTPNKITWYKNGVI